MVDVLVQVTPEQRHRTDVTVEKGGGVWLGVEAFG